MPPRYSKEGSHHRVVPIEPKAYGWDVASVYMVAEYFPKKEAQHS